MSRAYRHPPRRPEGWVALLAEVLRGTPRLDGALCRNRPEQFDCDDGAGVDRARSLCERCPSLSACRDWSTRERELVGVVAGKYRRPKRYDGIGNAEMDDELRTET